MFTSFTVDYSWKNFLAPLEKILSTRLVTTSDTRSGIGQENLRFESIFFIFHYINSLCTPEIASFLVESSSQKLSPITFWTLRFDSRSDGIVPHYIGDPTESAKVPRRNESSGVRRILFGGASAILHLFGWGGQQPILENFNIESYGTSENLGRDHGFFGPPSVRY